MPPTTVTVSPTVAVVAGQPVTLTCTVKNDVTLPVTFKWQRVQGTSRVDPPQAAVSATTGKSSTLTWTGITSQDGGQYECLATNEAGSKTSSPVTVTVYCKSLFKTLVMFCRFGRTKFNNISSQSLHSVINLRFSLDPKSDPVLQKRLQFIVSHC